MIPLIIYLKFDIENYLPLKFPQSLSNYKMASTSVMLSNSALRVLCASRTEAMRPAVYHFLYTRFFPAVAYAVVMHGNVSPFAVLNS